MTQPDPEAIARGLTKAMRDAVSVMEDYSLSDTPCRNAKDLAIEMGCEYDPNSARTVARALINAGLARSERGLVTDCGDFYGSGWLLTPLGLAVRDILIKGDSDE